jgi:copper homeostasis protein
MKRSRLETACFDLSSAIIAADQGANRLEYATDYSSGGVTPDIESFRILREKTNIPVYILIRCRAGNFLYNETELLTMEKSIHEFAKAGADGFVFGCLDENNNVDKAANVRLLKAAGSLPCTFHRAIDRTTDLLQALTTIISLGFSCILSSGGKATAMEGAAMLWKMMEKSDNKITIMPGGGIRSENLQLLTETCPSVWYHSACIPQGSSTIDASELQKMLKILQY